MFNGIMNKAIAAAIMSLLTLLELYFGFKSGITEEWLLALIAILTPIIVWIIPNRA